MTSPPSSPLSSVVAVVVTHRRPRLATQVVTSLLEEEGLAPDQVLLVVSGEGGLTDPSLEAAITVLRLPDNPGPAAGFREGMLAATRRPGTRWLYLSEDDIGLFGLPGPRIGRLLAALGRVEASADGAPVGAVVAYGRDLNRRTGHTTVHQVSPDGPGDDGTRSSSGFDPAAAAGFDPVAAAPWGASLVSREVIDAGILPDDAWFFGYEDFDFWYRLQAAGFRLLVDRASAAHVSRYMSLAGREQAFAGQRPGDVEEPWREFYTSRNFFLLARRHGPPTWVAAHLAYSARRLQLAPTGRARLAILHGLLEGARGHTGKHPRYGRSRGEAPDETEPGPEPADPHRLVLHVLPTDIARGGQVIARDLRDALDGRWGEHRILTLFSSEAALLRPDDCLDVPQGWGRRAGFDPRVALRLARALARLQPTVVVAHGGEPLKYLAALPNRGAPALPDRFAPALPRRHVPALPPRHAPLVYFAFGIVTESARRGLRHLLYRALMGRADIVAGISLETLDEARQLFRVDDDKLVLLPNSRDPGTYRPTDRPRPTGNPDEQVTLVFVGHLTATKRPERFVAAVEELRRRGHPVRGLLVGDGPMEAHLRGPAQAAGVQMLGRRLDVPDVLASADVFAFTSVAESEGMPGVLIEAGLAGLPTVATHVPGADTVIEPGRTGQVVPVEDFDALVGALESLALDAGERRRMGQAARRRCVELFSLEASVRRWCQLFDALQGDGPLPTWSTRQGPVPDQPDQGRNGR